MPRSPLFGHAAGEYNRRGYETKRHKWKSKIFADQDSKEIIYESGTGCSIIFDELEDNFLEEIKKVIDIDLEKYKINFGNFFDFIIKILLKNKNRKIKLIKNIISD